MHSLSITPPASCRLSTRLVFSPTGLFLLSLLLFALAAPLRAATLYVSTSGNDSNPGTQTAPYRTIQTAINNSVSGDTVTLQDGPYTGLGDVDLDPGGRNITVVSMSGTAIINCGGNSTSNPKVVHHAFYLHSKETIVLSGLTIENGYEIGNLYSSGGVNGGALDVESGSTVTATNCTFTANNCSAGGGIFNNGTTKLTGCTFSNNVGTGIYNSGTTTLTTCAFSGNSGGGVYSNGSAALTGCTISHNGSSGVVNSSGTLTVTGGTISNNTSSNAGGGISTSTSIYSSSTVTVSNCTISSNTSSNGGGGVSINGPATFTSCTISSNNASTTSGSGGGVSTFGPATLNNCIIAGNTATSNGGGIDNRGGLTATNCLINGNTASKGNGGGVDNESNGTGLLQFCTIATNSAGTQGGGVENDATLTLTDDIIWGNTAPYEAGIGIATTGNPTPTVTYSDIQGGLSGTGNLKVDPLFVNPTNDFHLTASSPCLHTGTPITGITTDLDGQTRGNPPSMGAYEKVGVPVTNGSTTVASSLNPSTVGQNVTFTATVTVLSGSPALAGTVQFAIDGTNVNSPVALSGSGTATASTSTTGLTMGSHSVLATYTPTNAYTGTTSASVTQVVNAASTNGSITVASSLNPSLAGQSVTFTATVSIAGVGLPLTGTVQFASDGVNFNSPVTINGNSQAMATTTTTALPTGTHRITATYTPTSAFTGTTVAAITQVVTATNHTHLLWNNSDGRVMLWSIALDGTFTLHGFGPYTDNAPQNVWHATAVATGADGKSHLLWNNTDGRVMLWTVDDAGNFSLAGYGPYTDNAPGNVWHATAVSVGPDNIVHLLWNNTDHRVMFWNVAPDFTFTLAGYGPYTDNAPQNLWSATALATGPDNLSHIVWNNSDGRVMLWNVDPSFSFTLAGYGPYTDGAPQNLWSAVGVSVGPDNMQHLLWSNTDRRAMFWNVDSSFNFTLAGYGPYTDNAPGNLWSATALATGPDNLSHILWDNTDYRAMLWGVDNAFDFTVAGYGPYTDNAPGNLWSATAVSAGPYGPPSFWVSAEKENSSATTD